MFREVSGGIRGGTRGEYASRSIFSSRGRSEITSVSSEVTSVSSVLHVSRNMLSCVGGDPGGNVEATKHVSRNMPHVSRNMLSGGGDIRGGNVGATGYASRSILSCVGVGEIRVGCVVAKRLASDLARVHDMQDDFKSELSDFENVSVVGTTEWRAWGMSGLRASS